ncbi:MAG: porin family protein [Neisseria sp.]|nr:porin family protein [Neisseria sp.]
MLGLPTKIWLAVCLLAAATAHADEDDTRLLLDQAGRQAQQYRQSGWLEADTDADKRSITIDGQTYAVGDSEEELAQGIFYALNLRQWHKAAQFLPRYRALPQHKPHLALMAEGLLARQEGDIAEALAKMQAAHRAAPEDVRIRLELARLYTEDNQNKEAAAAFETVLDAEMPSETREVVQGYLNNIRERSRWHGNISVGAGYNSNINQANGKSECVARFEDQCLIQRNLPEAQNSPFWQYSAVLTKKTPLSGHHSLLLRPLAYGTKYLRDAEHSGEKESHSEHTAMLYGGYNYTDAGDDFSLLPYVEHYFRNGHTQYRAFGAEAAWARKLDEKWSANARAEAKRFHYAGGQKMYFDDYSQYSAGAGAGYAFAPGAGVFANLDLIRKKYPHAVSSSKEYVARAGAYKLFEQGFYLNAMLIYRYSRYDAESFIAGGARRSDRQTVWLAAVGAPKWQFKKIYPELRFKHTVNRSNSDYYAYRQNEVTLGLKYRF